MLKSSLLFKKKYKLHGETTPEFIGLNMPNFQGTLFTWSRTYSEIFKPALVYL